MNQQFPPVLHSIDGSCGCRHDDSLDAAWAEAEAALPEGWGVYLAPDLTEPAYQAEGRPKGVWLLANGPLPNELGHGPTPAAALRALTVKLREAGR